ncbi:hypothetical protein STEG23_020443 [Scotinomys teguina]
MVLDCHWPQIMLLSDPEMESSILISSDEGATYQKYRLTFYIQSLLFHPKQEDWVLAYSLDQKPYLVVGTRCLMQSPKDGHMTFAEQKPLQICFFHGIKWILYERLSQMSDSLFHKKFENDLIHEKLFEDIREKCITVGKGKSREHKAVIQGECEDGTM